MAKYFLKNRWKQCILEVTMSELQICSDSLLENFAERLKVCGHPVRLKLLCMIEKEDACVTELWRCLNQSQPVISQHLAVLKDKGIVEAQIEGNKRIYSICDPFVRKIVHSLEAGGEEPLLEPLHTVSK